MTLRYRPLDLIEELREKTKEQVDEINEDMPQAAIKIGIPLVPIEDMLEFEAAEMLQEMHDALVRIHSGGGDPKAIAWAIIDPNRPMES